jgi:hypothetical protein
MNWQQMSLNGIYGKKPNNKKSKSLSKTAKRTTDEKTKPYLFRKGSHVIHYWNTDKEDTSCKLWSTGGIRNKSRFYWSDTTGGRSICQMCQTNKDKQND